MVWLNLVQSNLSQQFFLDLGKRFRQQSCTPVECFRGPGGEGGGLDSHEEREGLLENMAGGYFLGIVRKYRQRASGTWPERGFCLEAFVVRVRGGSRGVIWRMQTRGGWGCEVVVLWSILGGSLPPSRPSNMDHCYQPVRARSSHLLLKQKCLTSGQKLYDHFRLWRF